ncbi:MAG: hypothetical protein JO151_05960 [Verrucomicrobia bacterium]|nr:hypothetical protein [Verrucomicrobiota bacterium]
MKVKTGETLCQSHLADQHLHQLLEKVDAQSVADKSKCCPLCGKAGIRLVAFTDAAGVLHIIAAGLTPSDSS